MSLLTMLALFLAYDGIIAAIRSCAPESESARRERTRVVIPLPPKFGPPYDAAKLAQSLQEEQTQAERDAHSDATYHRDIVIACIVFAIAVYYIH